MVELYTHIAIELKGGKRHGKEKPTRARRGAEATAQAAAGKQPGPVAVPTKAAPETVIIQAHYPEVRDALGQVRMKTRRSMRQILGEAINDLCAKYNVAEPYPRGGLMQRGTMSPSRRACSQKNSTRRRTICRPNTRRRRTRTALPRPKRIRRRWRSDG